MIKTNRKNVYNSSVVFLQNWPDYNIQDLLDFSESHSKYFYAIIIHNRCSWKAIEFYSNQIQLHDPDAILKLKRKRIKFLDSFPSPKLWDQQTRQQNCNPFFTSKQKQSNKTAKLHQISTGSTWISTISYEKSNQVPKITKTLSKPPKPYRIHIGISNPERNVKKKIKNCNKIYTKIQKITWQLIRLRREIRYVWFVYHLLD